MKTATPTLKRNLVILVAVVVLAIVIAHSTEHPDLPYRAMPESAIVASDHADVRGRWRDFVFIPGVSNALEAVGLDVAEFRSEPGWRILIPLTTGRNTVLACTPTYGTDGQPVLWGASFAGWRRLVLRFLLATRWIPGLGRLDIAPGGSRYLQLGSKRHPSDWKVGFAMRDNVLLAALSTDGDAVRELERRLEEKSPAPAVFGKATPWTEVHSDLHRFWISGDFVGEWVGEPIHVWISELSNDNLVAGARMSRPAWLAEKLTDDDRITGDNAKAAALAADSAFLLALLPHKAAARSLNELLYPKGKVPAQRIEREEDALVYLTGEPYHGSLFGVRIPAVTALCPGVVLGRENVVSAVSTLSDGAKYPQVLEGIDQKSRVLVPIRWQKGNAVFKVFPEEYGVVELNRVSHGFTFCSAQMCYDAQQKSSPTVKAPWRDWLASRLESPGETSPLAFLWIDLAPIADEVRQMMALTRIAALIGIVRLDAEETQLLNTTGSFLNAFTFGGHIAVLASDDHNGHLTLELGLL